MRKLSNRLGTILKQVRKGEAPFTIITHIDGKVKKQEHTKVLQLVPAFVSTAMDDTKKKNNVVISVEDKTGKVVYSSKAGGKTELGTGPGIYS